jgi:hypothetical protein
MVKPITGRTTPTQPRLLVEITLMTNTGIKGPALRVRSMLEAITRRQKEVTDVWRQGVAIAAIHCRARRDRSFVMTFQAIPCVETYCFRPAVISKPRMAGTLPARVTSTKINDRQMQAKGFTGVRARLAHPQAFLTRLPAIAIEQ